MDFGQHMEVASLDATEEMMVVASFPPIPIGFNHHEDTYPYPSSRAVESWHGPQGYIALPGPINGPHWDAWCA